jgi:hypothetical protein
VLHGIGNKQSLYTINSEYSINFKFPQKIKNSSTDKIESIN